MLKRFLHHIRYQAREVYRKLDRVWLPLFASSRFSASLYYFAFSRKFDREHQAVLQGRRAYSPQALLRRNTHRLEKGLIMRPRRPLFAAEYIGETLDAFGVLQEHANPELLKWAGDVLQAYFEAVTPSAQQMPNDNAAQVILRAYEVFRECQVEGSGHSFVPYPREQSPITDISTDALHQLFVRRRSVRWFENKAVEHDKLQRAIEMASLAPSACNRQPYEFVISHDQQAVKLASMAMGTAGFAQNIPCLVVVVGQLDAYPHERDRHCIYIDAALASMQFMLACETLGLSTCSINWPDIESREQQMQNALELKPFQRPVMLMAVGYADPKGGVAYSQKKSAAELMRAMHVVREHKE